MHYAHLDSSPDGILSGTRDQGVGETVPSRSGEKEFEETFISDKLDLVFVLDTSSDMEAFYQSDLFGKSFLEHFQKYDWRFAYTDMSVDVSKLTQKKNKKRDQESEGKKDKCPFAQGLFLTVGGFASGQPLISSWGVNNLFDCVSKVDFSMKKEEKPQFANGRFLPFEHEGKKWNQGEKTFLINSVQNYNDIFLHTMKLGSGGKKAVYDSPIKKDSKAYPFLSMVLSMAKSGRIQSTNSSGERAFFREDSAIVYVLFTVSDFQARIDPEYFKESAQSFFGSEKRLRIIPVTVSSDSSLICQMRFQMTPSANRSLKLENFVTEFSSSSVLNICSNNLAEELFTEISKSLYPKGFLND